MTQGIISTNASFTYPHAEEPFLKDLSAAIKPGEVVLICGKSGSGKTTFTRLLNGISPQFIEGTLEGEVSTFGLRANETPIEEYVPVVGSVFQNPKTQHFNLDTTSELAFPCENMGMKPKDIIERIEEMVDIFAIEELMDRPFFELSGGEKQRVSFVSANMLHPRVLVLDEVTSNLDADAVGHLREMIIELKQQGVTIVLTEHRLAWTKGIVDRYLLLEDGDLSKQWTGEAFEKMTNKELHNLGLRALSLEGIRKRIVEMTQDKHEESSDDLTTHQLRIGYDEKIVQENLNIGFKRGQITGLMGSNGVGKSTFAETLTGLLEALDGKIEMNGKALTAKERIEKSFLVMQDINYQLFTESVKEEVLLGARYPDYKDEVLEILNLLEFEERHPMSLSGGQKQRVAIASAILSGKEIIIFDEPTSGLDYYHMERFGNLLNKLKQTEAVIIVITHDEELAAGWCDQIIKFDRHLDS